jgi:subtilisin family serine protease
MMRLSLFPVAALAAAALVLVAVGAGAPAFATGSWSPHRTSFVADGEVVRFDTVPGKFAVMAKDGVPPEQLQVELEDGLAALSTRNAVDIIEVTVPDASLREAILAARANPRVAWAEPVFVTNGKTHYLGGSFFVSLRPDAGLDAIASLNRTVGATFVRRLEGDDNVHKFDLPADRELDVLDVVELYRSMPEVVYAEPLFYFQGGFYSPNDPLYPQQWLLNNTSGNPGTPGADIDAPQAWDYHRGDPGIVIAILDEGVDVDHPDLVANMVAGYDTTGASPPGGVPGNADCGDGHGTGCAGNAAARQDNGRGVSGVAPFCSIMPVRIARGSVWTTNEWIRDGFYAATNGGADVLSNSWGGGASSSMVTNAISNARNNGRGGLGCVVLFASGNNDGAVSYPAYLSTVIAVGASSPCDERKDGGSCDGEWWWGSNHGNSLDVVAPGVLQSTTDIAGSCGYVGGDYMSDFGGTSGACPVAAGLAGLILSANPALTADQVQDIMESTADDQVGYPWEDAPGWDPYMGWGRINARRALEAIAVDPPVLSSVSPDHGGIGGGTQVTITGDNFVSGTQVFFGTEEVNGVTVVNPQTLVCTTPASSVALPVDVTVQTQIGSESLPDAFTYEPTLVALGTPCTGCTLTLAARGPAFGYWGVVKDAALGPKYKKGIWWEIGFVDWEILHATWFGDGALSGLGQGSTDYTIPDDPALIGHPLYFEGVFDGNGPEVGKVLVTAPLVTVTVQ